MASKLQTMLQLMMVLMVLVACCSLIWSSGIYGPSISDIRYQIELAGLNRSTLIHEFASLKNETNSSYTLGNKTMQEIFEMVRNMRSKIRINVHNFKQTMTPNSPCAKDIFLVVYIHSAPSHYKYRAFIRETWGNAQNFPDNPIRIIFLIGHPLNKTVQEALELENSIYGDLLQENFVDSYKNLTYKAIMGLKYIGINCQSAEFVLKSDDDIFVNIFKLIQHLHTVKRSRGVPKNFMLCLLWSRMKVMRDRRSKWYLSREEFPDDYFPAYCSGSAYIMSPDVVAAMYQASLDTDFFWVDDYYITGLLAQKAGVIREKFNSAYFLSPSNFYAKFTETDKWKQLVFGHCHNLNDARQVWANVIKEYSSNHVTT